MNNREKGKNISGMKLLRLGKMADKLEVISKSTQRSQAAIIRRLLDEELDKIPEAFKPKFNEVTIKKKKKAIQIVYLGELCNQLDIFSYKTKIPKSHLIVALLKEEFKKWPQEMFQL